MKWENPNTLNPPPKKRGKIKFALSSKKMQIQFSYNHADSIEHGGNYSSNVFKRKWLQRKRHQRCWTAVVEPEGQHGRVQYNHKHGPKLKNVVTISWNRIKVKINISYLRDCLQASAHLKGTKKAFVKNICQHKSIIGCLYNLWF